MDGVNKTLYIPLYGKSFVSKRGIILQDEKAEEILADTALQSTISSTNGKPTVHPYV